MTKLRSIYNLTYIYLWGSDADFNGHDPYEIAIPAGSILEGFEFEQLGDGNSVYTIYYKNKIFGTLFKTDVVILED